MKNIEQGGEANVIELVVGLRHPDGGLGLGLVLKLERVTKQKQTNRHGGRK